MTRRDVVRIETFAGCGDGDAVRYEEYRRLRRQVFVAEQGWSCLTNAAAPAIAVPDPADTHALFWLARNGADLPIGEVRIVALADAFPHPELFAEHLTRIEMERMLPRMGALNSLAVLPAFRRKPCTVVGEGRCRSVARALLQASLRGSRTRGLHALIATAQNVASARALLGVGFRLLDPPVRTGLHDRFLMANMGVVLEDSDGTGLSAYFERRQRGLLVGRSLEVLFNDWAAASQDASHRESRPAA